MNLLQREEAEHDKAVRNRHVIEYLERAGKVVLKNVRVPILYVGPRTPADATLGTEPVNHDQPPIQ